MEIQCLKLLLHTLTHLNDKESHLESTKGLLRLVQANQWTPAETLTLLQALSEQYTEDTPITEVLTLAHMYDISPKWTNDSGHSLIQALEFAGPERFQQDFRKAIRKQNEGSLDYILAELKTSNNLDDSVIDTIKNITTSVLLYAESAPKEEPFIKDSFECANLNTEDIQHSLYQLCKAVFDTKGWWPIVQQMVRWCVLVLPETSSVQKLVSTEEDPCVIAMFAATQVRMGNKLDIVLNSDFHSHKQTEEWSDFYKHLGISININTKQMNTSQRNVYESDIVYGTMDDFVSDYFQFGLEVLETRQPHLSRQFLIGERSVGASHNLELSRLKENDALSFGAEILQSLMGNFHIEDTELRHSFIKAMFQVLHTHLNKDIDSDSKIIFISQKLTKKELPTNEVFILSFLENLLEVTEMETEDSSSPAAKWCLDALFACASQFQASKTQFRELLQMVSNLVAQRRWTAVEVLNLLVTLTNHCHEEDYISIITILHLMEMYQVSSDWTDESKQSLLQVLDSSESENLIEYLENRFKDEKEKNTETLFDELRKMKNIDEQTLENSKCIVNYVVNLIESGEIENHKDVQQARNLCCSTDTDTGDLGEILAVLCNAVHLHKFEGKWWPRATQMISWSLLALSDTGKLLEMGTGEGKSCVIAMFAVLRALRGEKIDVVSSSSVLCERDAKEWAKFYSHFNITVDTNTDKTTDDGRKICYKKDVVYGTIEAFAADHLRQIFEMKNVRPDRGFQCIIIDEVDSLLLDQGVQLTYLSSPMVSMQHLNIILAMIWGHVSQYGFLSTGHKTFVQGPPTPFFKAIFDTIDTEGTGIEDPLDILVIAEDSNIVPKGFAQDICESEKDEANMKDLIIRKLRTVSQKAVVDFLRAMEQYVPCAFTVYTLDDNGLLFLEKPSTCNNQDIPEHTFLVLEEGLCCSLYDSEEILIKPIAELVSEKIQYTPCENTKEKISIPGFLRNLIEKKVSVWVQNAFLAIRLRQGCEYVVENDSVCPVDFRSTGIVEVNKKWGDGLQQFVEMKHKVKLSTISTVTNYVSNVSFFEKYHGKIYGTTGTLGSETDMLFLEELYPNLSVCKIPSFNKKKLFEVNGILKTSDEEWKAEIKHVVMTQISPNSYRGGRAALVICETINKAKEIYEELKSITTSDKIILYCRNDKNSLSKIDTELLPGHVIVATNLAGRGTDIRVSGQVNSHGGLFVILSFLSENTRVELQAFGRTARKGKPGSAQVIMATDHLQDSFGTVSSLEEAKKARGKRTVEKINDMMNDISEMKLREDLFSEYCRTLEEIYRKKDGDEEKAFVAIMNEFWGIWLQIKSEEIDQLKRDELLNSLKADLSLAESQCETQTSPCSSIYHYIKFGNIALDEQKWDVSTRLFEKAMNQDASWAAIAFYSHAYCTIMQKEVDYLKKAREDLNKAQDSLEFLSEECTVCLQFVKMSFTDSTNINPTSLEKQLTAKCNMISYFDQNITEAIKKLEDIEQRKVDATASNRPVVKLVEIADEDFQEEAYNMYSQGLKYAFSVEEEPKFNWHTLIVLALGLVQIAAGFLLAIFTGGIFSTIGVGLICAGIEDLANSIKSRLTGEFSWKSWAIDKAISIGISIFCFGVEKLIPRIRTLVGVANPTVERSTELVEVIGRQLKPMPEFLSRQAKNSLSVAANTNMKNVVSLTAEKIGKEISTYGYGKAEQEKLSEILKFIKNDMNKGIADDVKANMEKESLAVLVDSIILSHLQDKQQFTDLLQDRSRKDKLLAIFKDLGSTALQPFYADLSWQNKLNSSISSVITRVQSENKDTSAILTAIQDIHIGSLIEEATSTVLSLSNKFFSNLHDDLNQFKKENGLAEKVNQNELLASQTEMLKEFKSDLADTISALLADDLGNVFQKKFSTHIVSLAQNRVNGIVCDYVTAGLKSYRTEENLRAGQNNSFIKDMSVDPNSQFVKEPEKHSQLHAEKIRESKTPGTILDIRILSETLGLKVVIQTEDRHGKRVIMQELNPGTKPASETVTLIYRPKSDQYPDGHYDVLINNQTVSVNKDKSCLFYALAKGLKPEASEGDIASEADHLRSVEANVLLKHPGQWEPFIKRKEWTETIRGGDWYMAEGAAREKKMRRNKIRETKKVLTEHIVQVKPYKELRKEAKNKPGIGQFMNADHQLPVSSIHKALDLNQNSKLAKAMFGTSASPLDENLVQKIYSDHGPGLPTLYVPSEICRQYSSTKSKKIRELLTEAINRDDIVATFKLTILGAMPRFMQDNSRGFNNFQNTEMSRTRLKVFQDSFPEHSKELVNAWFRVLEDNSDLMKPEIKEEMITWIDQKTYDDLNDPYRNKVINPLQ
ncbi:hypothetical protein AALO_G00063170 [Alosa alosa]|uniref:Protein translocase subunit SecA n=2 Tax=Alosa alosa TaxID=278164 RepID=A0AAV6H025_9TELE|nr:hypothetical protein AALO_G00063170 [Alosa alosa]